MTASCPLDTPVQAAPRASPTSAHPSDTSTSPMSAMCLQQCWHQPVLAQLFLAWQPSRVGFAALEYQVFQIETRMDCSNRFKESASLGAPCKRALCQCTKILSTVQCRSEPGQVLGSSITRQGRLQSSLIIICPSKFIAYLQ